MSNYGQVAPDGGGAEYHWLGASDSINENNWAWADGSTLETSKISGRAFWGDGAGHGIGGSEPDNFNNQDCLAWQSQHGRRLIQVSTVRRDSGTTLIVITS